MSINTLFFIIKHDCSNICKTDVNQRLLLKLTCFNLGLNVVFSSLVLLIYKINNTKAMKLFKNVLLHDAVYSTPHK